MELDLAFYRENDDVRNRFCENEAEVLDFYLTEINESDFYLIRISDSYLVCKSTDLFSCLMAYSDFENGISVKCISEKEYEIFNLIADL